MIIKCPRCGGSLLVEMSGNYGDVFRLKQDGTCSKRRLKRFIYEHNGGEDVQIYCSACRESYTPLFDRKTGRYSISED